MIAFRGHFVYIIFAVVLIGFFVSGSAATAQSNIVATIYGNPIRESHIAPDLSYVQTNLDQIIRMNPKLDPIQQRKYLIEGQEMGSLNQIVNGIVRYHVLKSANLLATASDIKTDMAISEAKVQDDLMSDYEGMHYAGQAMLCNALEDVIERKKSPQSVYANRIAPVMTFRQWQSLLKANETPYSLTQLESQLRQERNFLGRNIVIRPEIEKELIESYRLSKLIDQYCAKINPQYSKFVLKLHSGMPLTADEYALASSMQTQWWAEPLQRGEACYFGSPIRSCGTAVNNRNSPALPISKSSFWNETSKLLNFSFSVALDAI